MDFILKLIQLVPYIIAAASLIASLTPTPKDDKLIGKVYKLIDWAALNICRAKEKQRLKGCSCTFIIMDDIQPFIYNATLDRVIDGDTVKLKTVDLGFNVQIHDRSVRIINIDTPESRINIKKYPERAREKEMCLEAKALLKDWLTITKTLKIRSYGTDKYGRILADVFCDQGNVAELLIEKGLACHYDGGTKTKVWE